MVLELLKTIIKEALEDELESRIESLRLEPMFATVEQFVEQKLLNDEYAYDFIELQALARNRASDRLGYDVDVANPVDVKAVKNELEEIGFSFMGREKVSKVRGVTSNPHGTHPFAGSGGGGTGMGTDFHGGVGFSHGGGPGAIGGEVDWDPTSDRSLKMVPRKR